jgi:hypothetical protein
MLAGLAYPATIFASFLLHVDGLIRRLLEELACERNERENDDRGDDHLKNCVSLKDFLLPSPTASSCWAAVRDELQTVLAHVTSRASKSKSRSRHEGTQPALDCRKVLLRIVLREIVALPFEQLESHEVLR